MCLAEYFFFLVHVQYKLMPRFRSLGNGLDVFCDALTNLPEGSSFEPSSACCECDFFL